MVGFDASFGSGDGGQADVQMVSGGLCRESELEAAWDGGSHAEAVPRADADEAGPAVQDRRRDFASV